MIKERQQKKTQDQQGKKTRGIVKKIVHVEIKNGERTERELTKEEIEKWIETHTKNTESE